MKRFKLSVVFLVLFFSLSPAVLAYDTRNVKDSGNIQGVVEYVGARVPADEVLTLSSETAYCGKSIPAKKYLIKNRKVENAIVYLVGIKAGKAIPADALTVTIRKCEFEPHIALAFSQNNMTIKNDDPVLHTFDVHASLKGRELYHVALHEKGSSVTKKLQRAGLLELTCYVHPWQHGYVYVFDHPYAAVSDEQGRFMIKDVPPGTYTVEAWHEGLGIKRISEVKVEAGKTTTIKLPYSGETGH